MREFFKRWLHKLFQCPTFWEIKYHFHCPECGKGYRCYWEGNDVLGVGIDFCDDCAETIELQQDEHLTPQQMGWVGDDGRP